MLSHLIVLTKAIMLSDCNIHYAEALSHLINEALKMVIRILNNGSYEMVSKQHFKTMPL